MKVLIGVLTCLLLHYQSKFCLADNVTGVIINGSGAAGDELVARFGVPANTSSASSTSIDSNMFGTESASNLGDPSSKLKTTSISVFQVTQYLSAGTPVV
jgi:hypothetical protein